MKQLLQLLSLPLFFAASATFGQIAVTGVTDLNYYNDTVTFSITNASGWTYSATVDGVAINPTASYTENRFGYHELFVSRTNGTTTETRTYKFIVKDVARGGSSSTYPEAGLGRWTPLRSVDAPDAVLDTAAVEWIAPAQVPTGFKFPVVAKLTGPNGKGLRVIGTARVNGAANPASFRIYRGAGSEVMTAPAQGGTHSLTLDLGSRRFTKSYDTVASPTWQSLSGAAGGRSFAAGSFIDMTGNVTVAAGQTLTFGPGCVIRCAQGVEFDSQGTILLNGTAAQPILFGPAAGAVWGGIWVHGTGGRIEANFAILTGGGANPSWISQKGMHSHRSNQPLVTWSDSATGFLHDCAIIDNPNGQALHGEESIISGVNFNIRRTLLQKTISGGQMHNVNLNWENNYLLEMPKDETAYTSADANDDYDGLYCDGGITLVSGSVFGWVKDDGMDAGSGNTSNVTVTDSWFESCYHEGMAWSEGGTRTVRDVVAMNCGQGLECGFTGQGAGSPVVDALRVYSTGNFNGIRYGDNYDWDYSGKFDVHDSLSLFNGDDVFGRYWGNLVGSTTVAWAYIGNSRTSNAYMHLEALPAQNLAATIVSTPQAEHSTLPTWDPNNTTHLARLAPFVAWPELPSGAGIGQENRVFTRNAYTAGGKVRVRLDRPTTASRLVPWSLSGRSSIISGIDTALANGSLSLVAGNQAADIVLPALPSNATGLDFLTLTLSDGPGVEITGNRTVTWGDLGLPTPPTAPTPATLVGRAATGWKYLAQATAAPSNWASTTFDDSTWPSGPAPMQTTEPALGGTAVPGNPANLEGSTPRPYNTTYFRKTFTVANPSQYASLTLNIMVDDGAVVYLNGQELRRVNVPATGTIGYNTAANGTPASESAFLNFPTLPLTALVTGTNLLAVEVHQSPVSTTTLLTTSSDMRLDLDLLGVFPTPQSEPASTILATDEGLELLWQESTLILQCSPTLQSNSWLNLPTARPPYTILPEDQRMFFRLRRP